MNTLWRKAMRDLRKERFRSLSIVLSLAMGIAGFFAVLASHAILTRALNDGYLATNPPSATLAVDRLDDDAIRAAASTPGVESVEPRRVLHGRIRSGPARWQNLALFVRPSFERSQIGTVSLESGAWPSRPDEIAIERDALQVARANIGDRAILRTESGTERPVRVTGSIHDVGQAQARMENLVYGYVGSDMLAALGEEPYYNELAIRVALRPLDERHIRDVANAVATSIEKSGHHVLRIDVPEPGQHPHAKIMGLLLLAIAAFGFFILVLSGAIVFNVLTALLAGQARQIGVMKALGGTRLQIARVYLLEAGLLGVAAVVLAIPFGLLGAGWHAQWLAEFLNFDVVSYAVPLWIYASVLAVGIGVPLAAAAIPVWLGTRVPVLRALAPNGPLGRVYGASIIDRALARVSGPSRVLLLAMRNIGRNRLRVALTLVTLAAGGVFYMSALNVRQSMIGMLDRLFETRRADLSISLASDSPVEAIERAARGLPGISAAEGWIVTEGRLSQPNETARGNHPDERERFTVVAVPSDSQLLAFDIVSGESLERRTNDVVVNTALFDKLAKPAPGEVINLRIEHQESSLRLAGIAREPFSPPTAYILRAFFDDGPKEGTANSLRIALVKPTSSSSLDAESREIDASLDREGIRALQTTTKANSRLVLDQHMVMIYVFLIVVSCILGVIGVLGLVTTVNLNVTERRREMGVLRAIGATPARVVLIVVIEGVIVGALAWLVATAAARPLGKAIGDLLLGLMFRSDVDLPLTSEPKGVLIWLAVSIVGSALASLWPAWQASRASVREALSYE